METELVNGRQKPTIAELKKLQQGQWIFTCSMKPLQFNCFDRPKRASDYNRSKFTDSDWERFANYDDFTTMEGSSHSVFNCGIRKTSESYAKWFLENKIDTLYPGNFNDPKMSDQEVADYKWKTYERLIREKCAEDGIEYEGF